MAILIIIRERGDASWSTLNFLSGDNAVASAATGPNRDRAYRQLWDYATAMAGRWQQTVFPEADIRVVDTNKRDPRRHPKSEGR